MSGLVLGVLTPGHFRPPYLRVHSPRQVGGLPALRRAPPRSVPRLAANPVRAGSASTGETHSVRPSAPSALARSSRAVPSGHCRYYELGTGVPQSAALAIKWYNAAAEGGQVDAQL